MPPQAATTYQAAQAKTILADLGSKVSGLLGVSPKRVPTATLARSFADLRDSVEEAEMILVAGLQRFGPTDVRLTALCRALCEQMAAGVFPNFVVSALSDGYQTLSDPAIIQVPAAEDCSLLGIPDLAHELGHWLFAKYREDFVDARFTQAVTAHVLSLRKRRSLRGAMPLEDYNRQCGELRVSWLEGWSNELAADMIEAWVFGAPFAYQHVRLCLRREPELYAPNLETPITSHPADHLRLTASTTFLKRAKCLPTEITLMTTYWKRYRTHADAVAGSSAPYYDMTYPSRLVRILADNVRVVCQTLGIVRFDQPTAATPDIRGLARDAWDRLQANPSSYAAWERTRRANLWQKLGVP